MYFVRILFEMGREPIYRASRTSLATREGVHSQKNGYEVGTEPGVVGVSTPKENPRKKNYLTVGPGTEPGPKWQVSALPLALCHLPWWPLSYQATYYILPVPHPLLQEFSNPFYTFTRLARNPFSVYHCNKRTTKINKMNNIQRKFVTEVNETFC